MASHYRKSLDWTEGHLSQAKSNLDRLYTALRDHPSIGDGSIDDQVMAALRDDLNTPLALARLHELAGQVNRGECNSNTLFASGHFMGLFHEGIHAWFTWQSPKDKEKNDISDSEIESLIKERNVARANKDFSRADQIRDQLQTLDIILEDAGAETTWRRG
jgi:cysteinyl-tRNA synthetase